MNEQETKELETLVKKLFLKSRQKPEMSSKERIKLILDRSLHELVLRDLLVLSGHLILAMVSMLSLFLKLFLNKPQRTKLKSNSG